MNRLQLSNQLQNQCNNIEIAFAGADMILIVHFHLQQHRGFLHPPVNRWYMGHALYPSWWPSLTEDEQIEHIQRLQTEREFVQWLALRTRHFYASSSKPTQPN